LGDGVDRAKGETTVPRLLQDRLARVSRSEEGRRHVHGASLRALLIPQHRVEHVIEEREIFEARRSYYVDSGNSTERSSRPSLSVSSPRWAKT
jgi:hypothetical protein